MSFILDALKKSESERQRQSGPALFEVKVAPPRGRFAIWAMALGGLLAINLIVVGWMVLRGSSSRSAVPSASIAAVPIGAPSQAERSPGAYAGARAANRFGAVSTPPLVGGAAAGQGQAPPSAPLAHPSGPSGEAGSEPSTASPDDLAPAVEPQPQAQSGGTGQAQSGGGGVVRATDSGLPTYQDASAEPGANIPDLHLDLNAYSPQPEQSFVFLNMMKLHEGESLPTGVRVEHILRDGVILSFHGKQFVLQTNP
jgi:general secretion pathway protein B